MDQIDTLPTRYDRLYFNYRCVHQGINFFKKSMQSLRTIQYERKQYNDNIILSFFSYAEITRRLYFTSSTDSLELPSNVSMLAHRLWYEKFGFSLDRAHQSHCRWPAALSFNHFGIDDIIPVVGIVSEEKVKRK